MQMIFRNLQPVVLDNPNLRIPQKEGFTHIEKHLAGDASEREVGVILPVGCGKSGLITLTPFASRAGRALVVAPNVRIAEQLYNDFDPGHTRFFYTKCKVLSGQTYPEPASIRGGNANLGDLEEADVVITNIQQLQGAQNKWLSQLSDDFFDLIMFDEAHHNVADSWELLRSKFKNAKIVNFSATPQRSDGQLMAGKIIYSYPIFNAIREGYVKKLKALVLNPKTLKYVRSEDGGEIEVDLDTVRRLGEEDADFRRSIVTSQETLDTIVNASIRELDRLRSVSGENRLKIIASALNQQHCIQIVEAYRARGRRADYIHSKEDSKANEQVFQRLERHELDVIVQVRKLGEGFDHPYLAVAAIFSIFRTMSPFVQFVGRIMRVIKQDAPGDILNNGTVVYHAGSNVARLWSDFKDFCQADQEYFDQLLPVEGLDFDGAADLTVEPSERNMPEGPQVIIRAQSAVTLQEVPLIEDEEAMKALQLLVSKGYGGEEILKALEAVPVTKQRARQAQRLSIDDQVKNAVGRVLKSRRLNPQGHDLDRKRLGRTNFVILKAAIDKRINELVGIETGKRGELTKSQLDTIEQSFDGLIAQAEEECFNGKG